MKSDLVGKVSLKNIINYFFQFLSSKMDCFTSELTCETVIMYFRSDILFM